MEKYYWLNEDSRRFLERGYLAPGQTAEERIREIAERSEQILACDGFADKFEDYMSRGWYSLASPVWSNFGRTGLPISCNGSFISDSVEDIMTKLSEVAVMTKNGSGTSGYFGAIRPRGSKISTGGETSGSVHFMELFESTVNNISQSNVRRGSFAAYLPIDHADIEEFLEIRSEGHPIQNLSIGVCVSDIWMQSMVDGDKEKRKLWAKIIKKRFETGYPYIFFTDSINRGKPDVYKELDLNISHSNLCTEIALPDDKHNSFVCCLSSMNLLHWDDWKNTDAVKVLTWFLDAVMEEYIQKTEGLKYMEAAHNFAKNHRALGLGVLGWHSLLQSKMIPFESMEAKQLNFEIFQNLQQESRIASGYLARCFGAAPLMKDAGFHGRNTTLLAVAPTTSSSFILGQISPSVEPLNSNYFVKDLAKGKFTYKNPYLKDILKEKGKDNKETWKSILLKGGSVQHLDFLTEQEKLVFKTFGEISQMEIIQQAAQRQKFIDQAQSINLMIHPQTPVKDVNKLMITAWELGVKTLYYQRGTNPAQELGRNLLSCSNCEG